MDLKTKQALELAAAALLALVVGLAIRAMTPPVTMSSTGQVSNAGLNSAASLLASTFSTLAAVLLAFAVAWLLLPVADAGPRRRETGRSLLIAGVAAIVLSVAVYLAWSSYVFGHQSGQVPASPSGSVWTLALGPAFTILQTAGAALAVVGYALMRLFGTRPAAAGIDSDDADDPDRVEA